MKQDLLGAVKLLDHESCCTEKWLVSYYDTNHFFAGAELKNAIRRTMKELMCAPACGAIVWGFVIETAEIGVSLLNLQLPIAFDFDLCYHANADCWTVLNFDRSYHESTNHIERQ